MYTSSNATTLTNADGTVAVTEPRFIRNLVMAYDLLERQCDKSLQRQEDLSRSLLRSTPPQSGYPFPDFETEGLAVGTVATCSGEVKTRNELRFSDISVADFRQLAQIARQNVTQNAPLGKKRFILNACSLEVSEIDEIEIEIMVFQLKMKEIETDILEHVPCSIEEVVAKLRFIVGLMLDGQEIDTDYFAYQIEECADVMTDLRFGRSG